MGGGLHLGLHTELFGEAGSGKSQLAMQLALWSTLNQHRESVHQAIFISLEKPAHQGRLQALARQLQTHDHGAWRQLLTLRTAMNLGEFDLHLEAAKEAVLSGQCRLIVVDPVSKIFDWEGPELGHSTIKKFKISMRHLLQRGQCALLTVNNVTDNFKGEGLVPRLGPGWSNDLHVQYQLLRPSSHRPHRLLVTRRTVLANGDKDLPFRIDQDGLLFGPEMEP
jgi:predicted ATP-dependent serine protease